MKRIVLSALAVVTLAGSSFAADLAPRSYTKAPPMAPAPLFSWTGCYIGGFVGGAFPGRNVSVRDVNGYNGPDSWSYSQGANVTGGGTLGCNYQVNQFVIGLEAEGGYLHVSGSALDPVSPFLPLDTRSSVTIGDWYALLAGRGGLAVDRALFYVKGGVAFVNTNVSTVDALVAGGNTISATNSANNATWALGGGIEYALTNNWSIKGEYLYIDTSRNVSACGTATIGGGTFCWSHNVPGLHTAKFGINYKFGGPVVARY